MPIKNRVAELHSEIKGWRQELHSMPELLFETEKTGRFIEKKLKEFGCDQVDYGMAKNGVVAVVHGKSNHSGRVIGLRADMDALPIKEVRDLPYASQNPGVMHACGHDGHSAMLLGAAKYLTETRNFDGTVVLIFQPAEEGGGGGNVMVEEGLMDKYGIQEVYGMHNMPDIAIGEFAIREGAFLAATDSIKVTVTGKGTHASKPETGVDTTLVAAHILTAVQSIVARNLSPFDDAVVSICGIKSDTYAHNIIPENVEMIGTVRTFCEKTRKDIETHFKRVVESTALAFGAKVKIEYERGYPATVNNAELTQKAADAAEQVTAKVERNTDRLTGGEDFSYMAIARPGAFILIGNGDTPMLHHPEYDFNDEAIPFGVSYWAEIVEARLPADRH